MPTYSHPCYLGHGPCAITATSVAAASLTIGHCDGCCHLGTLLLEAGSQRIAVHTLEDAGVMEQRVIGWEWDDGLDRGSA